NLGFARAQAARGTHQVGLDAFHAGDRVDEDREEAAEKNDELILHVTDAEPEDRKGDPGEWRYRTQDLGHRIDLVLDPLPPSHRDAERNRHAGPEESDHFALEAVAQVDPQVARARELPRRADHSLRRR